MTVKELKEKLSQFPDDMEIVSVKERVDGINVYGYMVQEPLLVKKYVKNRQTVLRPCKETAGAKKTVIIF